MSGFHVWADILAPAVLYIASSALLRLAAAQFLGPPAAGLLAPILLFPAVLLAFHRSSRTAPVWPQVCPSALFQWTTVTALMVLANTVLFPGSPCQPGPLLPLAVVGSVLCAPVCEELVYRGLVLERAGAAFGSAVAVVLTAILFGAAHTGAVPILTAALCGLLLGWMRLHFSTLLAPMLTHIILNLAALVL